ncbi:MAG: Hsp20/alpha crystallin family protein [Pseudomonadota bacterium]
MTLMPNPKSETKAAPSPSGGADVFGAMRNEMNHVFDRFETGWAPFPAALGRMFGHDTVIPQLDVHENGSELKIDVELPGVDEKDVSITLANGMLKVKGEKKSEREQSEENYHLSERSYGSFERSIRMPDTIDEASLSANFENGILRIVAQKRPDAIKPERKIEIKSSKA